MNSSLSTYRYDAQKRLAFRSAKIIALLLLMLGASYYVGRYGGALLLQQMSIKGFFGGDWTMPYGNERLGISDVLPGYSWSQYDDYTQKNMAASVDSYEGGFLFGDNGLVFAALRDKSTVSGDSSNLKAFARSLAGQTFLVPLAISNTSFHGYNAISVESVSSKDSPLPPDLHWVQYFFVKDSHLFMVGAGSAVSEWEKGGKSKVESILNDVKLFPGKANSGS